MYDDKGICKLTKKHANDWEARLDKLDDLIVFHTNNIPNKELTIIRIFYNEP